MLLYIIVVNAVFAKAVVAKAVVAQAALAIKQSERVFLLKKKESLYSLNRGILGTPILSTYRHL